MKFDEPDFLTMELNGREFQVDAYKAYDQFQAVIAAHKDDPADSSDWLDDIAALLRNEYGNERAGRAAANWFYGAVTGYIADLKKKLGTPAESLVSSAESTPEYGATPSSEPGSQT